MGRRRVGVLGRAVRSLGGGLLLGALIGCGGVQLGRDPETPEDGPPPEHTEIPQSGYADWPDETLPLVRVDLEEETEPPAEEGSEGEGDPELRENPETSAD